MRILPAWLAWTYYDVDVANQPLNTGSCHPRPGQSSLMNDSGFLLPFELPHYYQDSPEQVNIQHYHDQET